MGKHMFKEGHSSSENLFALPKNFVTQTYVNSHRKGKAPYCFMVWAD